MATRHPLSLGNPRQAVSCRGPTALHRLRRLRPHVLPSLSCPLLSASASQQKGYEMELVALIPPLRHAVLRPQTYPTRPKVQRLIESNSDSLSAPPHISDLHPGPANARSAVSGQRSAISSQ